jgi:plasmid stabilization system protein ParE
VTAAYKLSPIALADIDEIAEQIAETSEAAALRFIEDAYRCFDFPPHAGHRRPALTDRSVFFWPLAGKYAASCREAEPPEMRCNDTRSLPQSYAGPPLDAA